MTAQEALEFEAHRAKRLAEEAAIDAIRDAAGPYLQTEEEWKREYHRQEWINERH